MNGIVTNRKQINSVQEKLNSETKNNNCIHNQEIQPSFAKMIASHL